MFQCFAESAIQTIILAQNEAKRLGHPMVDSLVMLWGILQDSPSDLLEILQREGCTLEQVNQALTARQLPNAAIADGEFFFTPVVKQVLQRSLDAANQLGHPLITPIHLLLALLAEEQNADLWRSLNLEPENLRTQVLRHISQTSETASFSSSFTKPFFPKCSPPQASEALQPRSLPTHPEALDPFLKQILNQGYATFEQIQQALQRAHQSGATLVAVLQTITGQPFPASLKDHLKRHQCFELKLLYGVESYDLEANPPDFEAVRALIAQWIPLELCLTHRLIPLQALEQVPLAPVIATVVDPETGDRLQRMVERTNVPAIRVGMVDPGDISAQEALHQIFNAENRAVLRGVMTQADYTWAIAQLQSQS